MIDKHWTRYLPTDTAEYGKPDVDTSNVIAQLAANIEQVEAEEMRLFMLKCTYEKQAAALAEEQYSVRDVCRARNQCRNANNKAHGHVVRL